MAVKAVLLSKLISISFSTIVRMLDKNFYYKLSFKKYK